MGRTAVILFIFLLGSLAVCPFVSSDVDAEDDGAWYGVVCFHDRDGDVIIQTEFWDAVSTGSYAAAQVKLSGDEVFVGWAIAPTSTTPVDLSVIAQRSSSANPMHLYPIIGTESSDDGSSLSAVYAGILVVLIAALALVYFLKFRNC